MPSLNALREFRTSFYDIANEKEDYASKNLPFDDFELPKNEPPPFEYSRLSANTDGAPSPEVPGSSGDLDFSAFINDVPDNAPSSDSSMDAFLGSLGIGDPAAAAPSDDQPDASGLDNFLNELGLNSQAAPTPDAGSVSVPDDDISAASDVKETIKNEPEPDVTQTDEGAFPEDLLSGLSEEMESSASDFPTEEFPTDDFDMENFSPDEPVDIPSDELPDAGFDLSGGNSDEDFNIDDPGAIDLGGETNDSKPDDDFELPDFNLDDGVGVSDDAGISSAELSEDSFDLGDLSSGGDLPDFGSSDDGGFSADFPVDDSSFDGSLPDTGLPSESAGIDDLLGDMDFSGDGADGGTDASSGAADDGLGQIDDFASDLSIDTTIPGIDLPSGSGDASADAFSEEFHIPGLDDIFEGSKPEQTTAQPQKKGLFGRKKKAEEVPSVNDVEEIALSQGDLNKLIHTLSAFPLNLRIACEEIIAEQVILPQQLSKLLHLLVSGAPIKDTAAHVELITGKPVVIPKSFQKSTGAALEAEQASFSYIFVHNFLPVLRLFAFIIALGASVIYLSYKFIYVPLRAESIYKRGYERIPAGELQRANDLFQQAFDLHPKKKWFYAYAEEFRDRRHYMYAEGKYDELLRHYPRDKKGVLDYAALQTYYLLNYEKANRLLQRELIDFAPNDFQGLLAAGDNFLAWADSDPERFYDKYEDARFSFARLLEINGWQPPILERMLKYFIRTDNLPEVLQLRVWFENDNKRKMTTETLAELGGYLLDKQLEKPKGVPNAYLESIESVRAMLLQAVREDRYLPEPHYHLARYHKNLENTYDERLTLENAIRAFDLAKQESVKRRLYRVDAHSRYAALLINNKEFFPAETQIVRGIELYEDYLSRNLITKATPQLGQLYAAKGDLEFYTKTGDRQAAVNARDAYLIAEGYGYAPPEMLYRAGAAYYQLEDWGNSLNYLFRASTDMPYNRRLLYALGNAAYQRGDYFVAEGYYNNLLDVLENQRVRLPVLLPNDNAQFLEIGERLMMARNNAGVVYEALAHQTGNHEYRARAMSLYAESSRAWDAITRNPETMIRMRPAELPGAPGINLGYLNAANAMRPSTSYTPGIFVRIDRDGVEPSHWEELAPFAGM